MAEDGEKKSSKTLIILALISGLVAIIVASIENPSPEDPVNTPMEVTLTPIDEVIVTSFPSAIEKTPKTEIESPSSAWIPSEEYPGADWERGCISSETWGIYSSAGYLNTPVEDGCYQLIEYGVSVHQGNLAFVRTKVFEPEIFGFLIPIPNNAKIAFDLRINELENAEVLVGISESPNSWDGVYLFSKADDNFHVASVENNFPVKVRENYYERSAPNIYNFEFEIEGNLWDISYENSPADMFTDINLSFSPRYLFIGYRAYKKGGSTGNLNTRISHLVIEELP